MGCDAMGKKLTGEKIARNMVLSVCVQAISLLVGFVLNLIVPKYISELDYSYWQTFLLYSQYLGVFHFGFLDGFVLRYAQYDYEELDRKAVRSQYMSIMLLDLVISGAMLVAAFVFFTGVNRVLCILLSFTTCIEITYSFVSFAFQTTNRIKQYAWYVIVYRLLYCLLILACIVLGMEKYYWFCIVYLVADVAVILVFGLKYSRELFVGSWLPRESLKAELKSTLSSGVWLMVSTYAATLLIGSGKMIVQWFWDQLLFGKISLAFSLSSFVLQFVTALSVVLFPSLKRMDPEKLPDMYGTIRSALSPILFFALILYYPGSVILELWLPKYAQSVTYLGVLMPIIIYSSKVSLLTNNYLKAYRKERLLLTINISVVAAGFVLFLLCGGLIHNLTLTLLSIVFMIMLRSVVSEMAVMKLIGKQLRWEFVLEFAMTAIFIAATMLLERWTACAVYLAALLVYFVIQRKALLALLQQAKTLLRKSR